MRKRANEALIWRWRVELESPVAGMETVEAIRPHLQCCLKRKFEVLTLRLVEVLTVHGCFGKYLTRIPDPEYQIGSEIRKHYRLVTNVMLYSTRHNTL